MWIHTSERYQLEPGTTNQSWMPPEACGLFLHVLLETVTHFPIPNQFHSQKVSLVPFLNG